MYPILVADIGGTNARYALATGKTISQQEFVLEHQRTFATSDFASVADSLHAYLSSLPRDNRKPRSACMALAGPIGSGIVKMTNLNWFFDRAELREQFDFERVELINDFAAQACAIPCLSESHRISIKEGNADNSAPKVIMGPGTGLGVANLVPSASGWIPITGEAGHTSFTPGNALETDVLNFIWRQQASENRPQHLSTENLLSGPGLVTLYRALAEIEGISADNLQPNEITENIANDALCKKTVDIFCSALGGLAGDLALITGAKGGVFLAGGILPKIKTSLDESSFISRFSNKGLMTDYMQSIPIDLVTHPHAALVGAAAWQESQYRKDK